MLHFSLLTCNDPGVEVERHLPAVLENDGLEEVTVSLELDLLGLGPGARVEKAGAVEALALSLESQRVHHVGGKVLQQNLKSLNFIYLVIQNLR